MPGSSTQSFAPLARLFSLLLLASAAFAPVPALAQDDIDAKIEKLEPKKWTPPSAPGAPSDHAYRRAEQIYNQSVARQALKELFENCDRGVATACAHLASHYSPVGPDSKDEHKRLTDKAWALAKAECDESKPESCQTLGYIHLMIGNDREEAQRLFKAGCDADRASSCHALGNSYYTAVKGERPDLDELHVKALAAYEKACALKFAGGCSAAGRSIYGEALRLQARSMIKAGVVQDDVSKEAVRKAAATAKDYYMRALAIDPDDITARDALLDLEHKEYFDSIAEALKP